MTNRSDLVPIHLLRLKMFPPLLRPLRQRLPLLQRQTPPTARVCQVASVDTMGSVTRRRRPSPLKNKAGLQASRQNWATGETQGLGQFHQSMMIRRTRPRLSPPPLQPDCHRSNSKARMESNQKSPSWTSRHLRWDRPRSKIPIAMAIRSLPRTSLV